RADPSSRRLGPAARAARGRTAARQGQPAGALVAGRRPRRDLCAGPQPLPGVPMTAPLPQRVRSAALAAPRLPAFIYALPGLAEHARAIRAALPHIEIYYAAKANPDAPILRTLAPYVDGFEVSSGGELAHLHEVLPGAPLAFGGPGKTSAELGLALEL